MGKSEQTLSASYRAIPQIKRQTPLCEAPGFAFSDLDFAKPKMSHKLEVARTSVIQGFSNMHQPCIRTMLTSWNRTPLFPAANKRPECMGGLWFTTEEEDSKKSLQNNHSRRDTSCPVTLKVLNPFG